MNGLSGAHARKNVEDDRIVSECARLTPARSSLGMVNGLTKMEIVPIAATAKKQEVNRDLALKIALTQTGANGEPVFWKATVEFAGMLVMLSLDRNAGPDLCFAETNQSAAEGTISSLVLCRNALVGRLGRTGHAAQNLAAPLMTSEHACAPEDAEETILEVRLVHVVSLWTLLILFSRTYVLKGRTAAEMR